MRNTNRRKCNEDHNGIQQAEKLLFSNISEIQGIDGAEHRR
jgi:hypothetical protein